MFFDPLYFVILAPGILLALWAQWRVQSAYSQASQIPAASGLAGAEAADQLLRRGGVHGVAVEPTPGHLTDHYSPSEKVLRLSPEVFAGRSLASLGIAAHEAGHAFQDAEGYPLLVLRNALVPAASVGSSLAMLVIVGGFLLMSAQAALGYWVVWLGIALFSTTVVFQLVNLPVEFDASRRARLHLLQQGLITRAEDTTVKNVLDAAALTYVAATLSGILTLLYFVIRANGSRD
jgi:Zn-dependent membrane protease YugP